MNRNHKKYSNFLILSFMAVFIYGVYYYFSDDLINSEAADGSITSSLTTSSDSNNSSSNSKANEDTAFVRQLASLSNIKIDKSLFEDNGFKLLVDNNIKLENTLFGRKNPFSPVNKIIPDLKASNSIITGDATAITVSGAILNGSVEGVTSTNIYFEYGPTEAMGKVTLKATPSSVGGIAMNVSGLATKTKYFYRLVVNTNGVMSYGNIVSFITK